jgi:DNA-binding NtrC family response regulator
MMSPPKHILVVDDNGDVRDVIVAILESYDFRVSHAASRALMRDFLQTADPVDCVVLDVLMPGEGNISLALHLKEVGLPVVVISGSHDAMDRAEEYNLQLLRKPFHAQELFDAVNTALPAVSLDNDHRVTVMLVMHGDEEATMARLSAHRARAAIWEGFVFNVRTALLLVPAG